MRKFRFRAWDRYAKKMCDVYTIDFPTGHLFTDIGDSNLGAEVEALMQSTGLHDKNGVEIFEGDIVTDGKHIAVVEYQKGAFGAIVKAGPYIVTDLLDICDNSSRKNVEVIGNIYENPELLGGEK